MLFMPTIIAPLFFNLFTDILSIGEINFYNEDEPALHLKPYTRRLSLIDNGIPSNKLKGFLLLYLY